MARQLRFAEFLSLVPSSHVAWQPSRTPDPGHLIPSSDSEGTGRACDALMCTQTKHSCINSGLPLVLATNLRYRRVPTSFCRSLIWFLFSVTLLVVYCNLPGVPALVQTHAYFSLGSFSGIECVLSLSRTSPAFLSQ